MSRLSKNIRCFALCLLTWALSLPATGAERPSVLFLNIDDWNDWNSVLKGHPQAITPNLERFAARGVTFTRAICSSPVCFPSRTSIFSGLHPSRTGAKSNSNGGRPWRSYVPDAIPPNKPLDMEMVKAGRIPPQAPVQMVQVKTDQSAKIAPKNQTTSTPSNSQNSEGKTQSD